MPELPEIRSIEPHELDEPLRLLESFFRDGVAVPDGFRESLKGAMERGDLEVISAFAGGKAVGVLTLAFRPNVSLGGTFGSIEDLYVEPEHRGKGVGKELLRETERRCQNRSVSYLEAQTEDDATDFYRTSGFDREDVRVMSRSLPVGGLT